MNTHMIGDIPTTSITEMKKNPMSIVEQSKDLKEAVYLLNRNRPVAVVMDKDEYEAMQDLIEDLEEKVLYTEVKKRLKYMKENSDYETIPVEDVIGKSLDDVEYSEDDGWE